MKPGEKERNELRARLLAARSASTLSNAEIARRAGVDPAQALKICRGDFKTLGGSLVRICNVLGVDPRFGPAKGVLPADEPGPAPAGWARLAHAMRRLGIRTPEDADRLATVIDAVVPPERG